ncbi:MAG: UDP-N-acetylmuramate dehydrogenase [Halothiobacillaceae bacterium]|nr:UDP-N-acetylmuramate dehydrogenase [Halothiobacillaceae bacterium]HER20449.1 UDP-N-acetylmuramate dehydrogenase [Chromatiales bacterium]
MNRSATDSPSPGWRWREHMPLVNTLRLPARSGAALILDRLDADVFDQPAVTDWLAEPTTRVLGGGSNVVFVQPFVERSAHLAADAWWLETQTADRVDLVAEGGMGLDRLVRETSGRGWYGLEALAEIPGTVAAAPMQNVGAYGVELGDRVRWVDAWDRRERRLRRLDRNDCDFGYRRSRFKDEAGRWLILRVGLTLATRPPADWPPVDYPGLSAALEAWQAATGRPPVAMTPLAYADMITRVRLAKLPDWRGGLPGSAGSFFHNPVVSPSRAETLARHWPEMPQYPVSDGIKIPAGWLIERCGLRGWREGGVGVSARHALVLLHYGGASGEGFVGFAREVRDRVFEAFGIALVVEPECLGEECGPIFPQSK